MVYYKKIGIQAISRAQIEKWIVKEFCWTKKIVTFHKQINFLLMWEALLPVSLKYHL